jgi:hypothetical protein
MPPKPQLFPENSIAVIPAKAGIQFPVPIILDSSLRWNDMKCYLLCTFQNSQSEYLCHSLIREIRVSLFVADQDCF